MATFFLIILLILAILLIIAVLLQPGKGDIASLGGLSGQFSSVLGTRKAANFLQKLTIGFAGSILVLSLITNLFLVGGDEEIVRPPTEGLELPASNTQPASAPALPEPLPEEPNKDEK